MDLKIRILQPQDVEDLNQLLDVFLKAFEEENPNPPSKEYLAQRLIDPRFIVLVAEWEGNIIGGITAYELPLLQSAQSEYMIYDVAVAPDMQRKGVGKKMMEAFMREAQKQGIQDVFLQTHEEDLHAISFYEKLGGSSEEIRQFIFSS